MHVDFQSFPIEETKSAAAGLSWRSLVTALLLSGAASAAPAQDAGFLLRQQELQSPNRESLNLRLSPEVGSELLDSRRQSSSAAPAGTGDTVFIRELRYTGRADLLPPVDREKFAGAIRGRRFGIDALRLLADDVTAALQKQGRLLARADLPPQDVTEGILTLHIVDGMLERIDIHRGKDVRIRDDLLQAIAQRGVEEGSVTREAVEEALLQMNELPGVTVRGRLMPGTAPNTTRLAVDVEQTPVFSASLWGDNHGSPDTSRTQGNALATFADLTGHGDRARLTGIVSEGQNFAQAEVSLPLGASGFSAQASYGYLSYRNIAGLGLQAGLEGFARHAGVGVDYGLLRARGRSLQLSANVRWKALVDDTSAGRLQDKRVQAVILALAGESQDDLGGGALTNWHVAWTLGDLDLSRLPSALAADAAGLQSQGGYRRVNAGLSRLQALPGPFALFAQVSSQWADKNLDSSEEFALGGPYGVRGWPVGEGRGDMGVLGTVEFRYDAAVPAKWGKMQLSAFLDGGRVRVNTRPNGMPLPTACACNSYSLAGAGLGMRWTRQDVSMAAFYAQGLGSNPGRSIINGANADGRTNRRRLWLQGAIRF